MRVDTGRAGVAMVVWLAVGCGGEPNKGRPLGGVCDSNGQCASGLCFDNVCLDPDADEDGDTLTNQLEIDVLSTDPFRADSDQDGISDPDELTPELATKDSDGDGIGDALEAANADADKDCLADQFDARNTIPDGAQSPDLATVCPEPRGVCATGMAVACPTGLGAPECDLVAVPGYEAAESTCDALDNDCDGVTDLGCVAPVAECDALEGAARTSGPHAIDPDGAGGAEPFEVACLFDAERGGWTRLVGAMVEAVAAQGATPRELFYGDAAGFHRSPVTRLTWPADGYRELAGLWVVSRAGVDDVFDCAGGLVGEAGLGCATSGVAARLQVRDFDAASGTAEVCGAALAGGGPDSGCVSDAPVWVRSRACMTDAASLTGDGGFDALAAAADQAGSPCWRVVGPSAWREGIAGDSGVDAAPEGALPALRVTADPESDSDDRVIVQDEVSFIGGRAYRLTLWGKATAARRLRVVARATGGAVLHAEEVSLGTTWQELTVDFEIATTVWAGQVELELGGLSDADMWLDTLRLVDSGPLGCGECSLLNAESECVSGICQISECAGGYESCDERDDTGCETPLGTTSDCTDCDDACARDHAIVACGEAGCEITGCEDGFAPCDDDEGNGCETPLGTPDDCTDCGDACVYPQGVGACEASGCALVDCRAGYAHCDLDEGNGCETTLGTTEDCTDCGDACVFPHAAGSCGEAGCVRGDCDLGYGDCNPSTSDGCETSLRTTSDCGDCDVGCARAHASVSCATMVCEITSCDTGWGNCNAAGGATDEDGCEQTLTTTAHCGDCDTPCEIADGVGECSTGACAVAECAPDFDDCDEDPDTGCETWLVSDARHCGQCGRPCADGYLCADSECVLDEVVALGAGEDMGCGVRASGYVGCWGRNAQGQLGDGTLVGRTRAGASLLPVGEVLAIEGGTSHACARMVDGGVRCWGANAQGQLGDGSKTASPTPVVVVDLGGVVTDLSVRGNTSCAVREDQRVVCWGANDNGELGIGTLVDGTRPEVVSGITTAVDVEIGNDHACALLSDETVRCWGYNNQGQLGNGSTAQSTTPVVVTNLLDAKALSGGLFGTCAVRANDTVVCWGAWGGANNATTPTAVSFGGSVAELAMLMETNATCARRSDGRVLCMGRGASGQLGDTTFADSYGVAREVLRASDRAPLSGVTRLAAGSSHVCALDGAGEAVCWGGGLGLGDGQLAGGPLDRWSAVPVVGMSGGQDTSCATDLGSGLGRALVSFAVDGQLGNYTTTACGGTTSGRERRFRWVAPADGRYVVTTVGSTTNTILDVRAGSCDGPSLVCNDNTSGLGSQSRVVFDALAGGTYVVHADSNWDGSNATTNLVLSLTPEVCSSEQADCNGSAIDGCEADTTTDRSHCGGCGVACDFDEACVGGACEASATAGPAGLAGGDGFACALSEAGAVACWGVGVRGQLAGIAPTYANTSRATRITSGAVQIDAGTGHVCARMDTGSVSCWGEDAQGQLGIGYGGYLLAPTPVANLGGPVVDVSAGGGASCAVRADGRVLCWGENNNGELGNGTTSDSNRPGEVTGITTAVDVEIGNDHACALLSDETVRCWGYNNQGQLGNGSTAQSLVPVVVNNLSNAQSLSGGLFGTCAVRAGGSVVCWGAWGGASNATTPTAVSFGGPVATLAMLMETNATCVQRVDGRAFCMGRADSGQLGDATFADSYGVAREVLRQSDLAPLAGVTRIAAGGYHTCVIDGSEGVSCWGDRASLGDGQVANAWLDRWTAVGVVGQSPAVVEDCATDLGSGLGRALVSFAVDGQLGNYTTTACGGTTSGRERRFRWVAPADGRYVVTTVGSTTNTILDVRAGSCDGPSLVCNDNTTGLGSQSRVVFDALAGGTYVVHADSNWDGSNATTNLVLSLTPEVCSSEQADCNGSAIDGCEADTTTDRSHCGGCGVACDFDEACVGGVCEASATAGPASLAGGDGFACALSEAGAVACWGVGVRGQLAGIAPTYANTSRATRITSGAVQIDAGTGHVCARMDTGSVSCWGEDAQGQLGIGYGGYLLAPTPVANLGGSVVDVSAGGGASCAVRADGRVLCWGENNNGELGNGTTSDSNRPGEVTGITTAVDVEIGNDHACALLADETVRCWGYNNQGQLGNGSTAQSLVPVVVNNLSNAKVLSGGLFGTCAVRAGGSVVCWGAWGGASNATTPTAVSFGGPVATLAMLMETNATCVQRVDGRAFCMGRADSGQLGDATFADSYGVAREVLRQSDLAPLAGVTRIAAGGYHTCVIDGSEGVSCWGDRASLGDGQVANAWLDRWTAVGVVGQSPAVVEDCATDLGSGLGRALVSFAVDGQLGNYTTTACGGTTSGRERRFRWVAPADGRYVVTTVGSTTNTILDVRDGSCDGPSLVCNDNTSGLGSQSRVVFDALAGGTYVVHADSNWDGSNATTNLVLSLTPEVCSSEQADCNGSAIDGCEADTTTDRSHCGGCGVACDFDEACVGGACEASATAGPAGLAGGDGFACALSEAGAVACWGVGVRGQLAGIAPTYANTSRATRITSGAVQIDAGTGHVCARMDTGSVSCWGEDAQGQLGIGYGGYLLAPTPVANLGGPVVDVSAGGGASCAVRADGRVMCWGENNNGELGNGTTSDSNRPGEVTGITTAVDVEIGNDHACALLADETVRCWGYNNQGQLGNGSTAQSLVPVVVNNLSNAQSLSGGLFGTCAVRAGGSVVCWGAWGGASNATTPTAVSFGGPVATLAMLMETNATCVQRVDGRAFCMGRADAGQLGDATFADSYGVAREVLRQADLAPLAGVTRIAAGGYHTCVIDESEGVSCWGDRASLGDGQVANAWLDRWTAVGVVGQSPAVVEDCATDLGSGLGRALVSFAVDGQLGNYTTTACGGTTSGRERRFRWVAPADGRYVVTTVGSTTNTILDVRVGDCGGPSLVCNDNTSGLGSQSRVVFDALAGGTYVVHADSNWDGSNATTNLVLSLTPEVCSSEQADCNGSAIDGCEADTTTDRYHCGGCNVTCELDEVCLAGGCVASPAQAPVALASGGGFGCAVTGGGQVQCWGQGASGELGDGLQVTRTTPRAARAGGDVVQVDAGTSHACARSSEGVVVCWGANSSGQIGLGYGGLRPSPSIVANLGGPAVDVSAAGNATCVVRADGRVLCWGENNNGELGNGTTSDSNRPGEVTGITTAVDVEIGNDHACALLEDQTVRCWGLNNQGQLGNASTAQSTSPVVVTNLADAASLYAGLHGTCAIRASGPAVCWGAWGGASSSTTFTTVDFGGPVASLAMAAESDTTCARLVDGSVRCVGRGASGQLGHGAFADSFGVVRTVVAVEDGLSLAGVAALAAGDEHVCALAPTFGVRCWGAGPGLGDGQHASSPFARWAAVPVVALSPTTDEDARCDNGVDDDGDLAADCADDDCAADLGSAVGSAVASFTLDGSGANRSQPPSACTGAVGRERRLRWTSPATGAFVLTTQGSTANTVLEVRATCSGLALVCNDNFAGLGSQSRVTLDAVEGTTYTIVLDSNWDGSNAARSVVLNITEP